MLAFRLASREESLPTKAGVRLLKEEATAADMNGEGALLERAD